MHMAALISPSYIYRKLSHPKLVQLHGICLQQAPMCLVFEFMEHGCLSEYLYTQRGNFSKEDLLGMCQDVCEGMAYLEQASVIHRDLVWMGHVCLSCHGKKPAALKVGSDIITTQNPSFLVR